MKLANAALHSFQRVARLLEYHSTSSRFAFNSSVSERMQAGI